jgi:hypothetical protein
MEKIIAYERESVENLRKQRIKKAWEEKRKEKDLQAQSLFGTEW